MGVKAAMNAEYLSGERIGLDISVEELHVLRDALRVATWQLRDGNAQREKLLEQLGPCGSPEKIAETLAETDVWEDSLEEVRHSLAVDEKLAADINLFSKALEDFVDKHDLARCL